MPLDLCDYDKHAAKAIKAFWKSRDDALKKHLASGKSAQGERSAVVGGKNMDGFARLVKKLVKANGLRKAKIYQQRALLTLPGYFRPTKLWDLLVMHEGRLIAALEFKSQVGPSFGNNFNNRTEEAIGTAHDFWTAYREGSLGTQARPFLGWLMVVEDAPASNSPVKDATPHFPVFPEFEGASYLRRYDVLCQRLAAERLYSAAAVIATPKTAIKDGSHRDMSTITGIKSFVSAFAGHIATEAARLA